MLAQVILGIVSLQAASEPVDVTPQCSIRYATKFVRHFSDLPDQIRDDILKRGKVADVGQPFEAYDHIADPDLPTRRMVMAGQSHQKWFVWIDHGGFSRHPDVFGFSLVQDKADTFRWYRSAALQGDPCVAINAFLDGVYTSDQVDY